jgi:transposase
MKIPTIFVTPLNTQQTQLLKNLHEKHTSTRIRMRAHSILLSSKLFSVDEIATIYDVHRDSVSSWINSWKEKGVEGLFDKTRTGASPKLTESEIEIVKDIIKNNPQSPKIILAKITKKIGKTIGMSTLKRIVKKLKLRWKRFRKSLKSKRDQKEFEKAQKEIKELKKQQQAEDFDIIYFDESGFSLTPSVPYAYQPIGETIEVPSSRSKRLNVAGFYSTDNRLFCYCFECSIDSSVVVACFNEFCKTINKKTIVIIDNAPVHHSIEFVENIPEWEEKGLILKYLPKYSPELNLIEILWRFMKYHWLPVSAYLSYENLVNSVEYIIQNVGVEFIIDFT